MHSLITGSRMAIKFRTVRRSFLGGIAVISLTCIALAIALLQNSEHKASIWALVAIPGIVVCGAIWSICRRLLNKNKHQTVAIEITWTFAVFPFEIILGLFVATVAPDSKSAAVQDAYCALYVLTWINSALVGIYVLSLISLALLTQCSYDTHIWYKSIDASPSPFPLSFIRAYIAKSFGRRSGLAEPEKHVQCLPGCNCTRKPVREVESVYGYHDVEPITTGEGDWTLVPIRIPTEDERRNSIVVAFDV